MWLAERQEPLVNAPPETPSPPKGSPPTRFFRASSEVDPGRRSLVPRAPPPLQPELTRARYARAPSPPPPLRPATFPRLTERVEVLDSGHTIRFLFLGGNGLRKAAAGEGGRGGRSVGKRGGSRGRQLSPRRRLSDWGGGAAPVFTYIAAPVTPARCPHVSAPPMASSSQAPVRCGFLLVGGRSRGSTRAHCVWLGKDSLLTQGGARGGRESLVRLRACAVWMVVV